jgi:hypothetical protein
MNTKLYVIAFVASICSLVHSCVTNTTAQTADTHNDVGDEMFDEDNGPVDGMFFDSDNVVAAYDYQDEYFLIYNDCDAGMDCETIRVDYETYSLVRAARKSGVGRLVGSLYVNDEYDFETYSYQHNDDVCEL